jgi:hypothetical protein
VIDQDVAEQVLAVAVVVVDAAAGQLRDHADGTQVNGGNAAFGEQPGGRALDRLLLH